MNDEAFGGARAWQVARHKSMCPLSHNVIRHYTNKAAFSGVDDSIFGSTIPGNGGSDGGERSYMAEGSVIAHRTPLRDTTNFGFETFGNYHNRAAAPIVPLYAGAMTMARPLNLSNDNRANFINFT